MSWTKSLTRVIDAKNLWTYQLTGKTNIDALTDLFATESQAWEELAEDIQLARAVETAVGTQLDELGALIGQPREGRNDDRYRVWIKARIIVNRSSGSPKDLYAVGYQIFGQSADLFLKQIPVGHALIHDSTTAVLPDDVVEIFGEASSVTVPFDYVYRVFPDEPTAYTFTFASGTTPVASSNYGFDSGRLLGLVREGVTQKTIVPLAQQYPNDVFLNFNFSNVPAGAVTEIPGEVQFTLTTEFGNPAATAGTYRGLYSEVSCIPATDDFDVFTGAQRDTLGSYFVGNQSWTLCMLMRRPTGGSPGTIFRVIAGSTGISLGTTITNNLEIQRFDAGASDFFVLTTLPNDELRALIISYDDPNARYLFWENGVKSVFSATPGISIGSSFSSAYTTMQYTRQAGEFALFNRVITEEESVAITDHLLNYTDTYI